MLDLYLEFANNFIFKVQSIILTF